MASRKHPESTGSLGERFSYGLSTAVLSLVLGSLLWMIVNFRYAYLNPIPFDYVLYFCAVMGVLGFLFCQNLIVEVLALMTHAIRDPLEERMYGGWAALVAVIAAVVVIWYLNS